MPELQNGLKDNRWWAEIDFRLGDIEPRKFHETKLFERLNPSTGAPRHRFEDTDANAFLHDGKPLRVPEKWDVPGQSPSDVQKFDAQAGNLEAFKHGNEAQKRVEARFEDVNGFLRLISGELAKEDEFTFPGFSLAKYMQEGDASSKAIVADTAEAFAKLVVEEYKCFRDAAPDKKAYFEKVITQIILGNI